MGFFRDWFDRKTRGYTDIDVLMNPMLEWKLKSFVCIPEDRDGWLRHYFQFLDKGITRLEFIVFYAKTIGGWSYERTAYRKQPEEC